MTRLHQRLLGALAIGLIVGKAYPAVADPPGLIEGDDGLWRVDAAAAAAVHTQGRLFARGAGVVADGFSGGPVTLPADRPMAGQTAPAAATDLAAAIAPTVDDAETAAPTGVASFPQLPPNRPVTPTPDFAALADPAEDLPVVRSSAATGLPPLPPTAPERPENMRVGQPGYGADGLMTVAVFGDSLAEGIWGSLYRALERDPRVQILKRAQHSTGFSRPDYYNWEENLAKFLEEDDIDLAVFSVGFNDVQSLYYPEGGNPRFGTDAWVAEYRNRVEEAMGLLQARGIPTYWVGLPVTRSESFAENIARLNEIYRAEAGEFGVRFVPTWEITVDENGNYSAYLPDSDGRVRNMRANDGIHFTTRGYDVLSRAVLSVIRQEIGAMDEVLASLE